MSGPAHPTDAFLAGEKVSVVFCSVGVALAFTRTHGIVGKDSSGEESGRPFKASSLFPASAQVGTPHAHKAIRIQLAVCFHSDSNRYFLYAAWFYHHLIVVHPVAPFWIHTLGIPLFTLSLIFPIQGL